MSFIKDTQNTRYFIDNRSGQPGGFLEDADSGYEQLSCIYLYQGQNQSLPDRYKYKLPGVADELKKILPISTGTNINAYWNFILTSLSEGHQEVAAITHYLSDSYGIFCTGGTPINISLSGMLAHQTNITHLIDFINLYDNFFRGYSQYKYNFDLIVYTERTTFIFKPNMFSFVVSSRAPTDFAPFQITGIAYRYYTHTEESTN